MFAKSDHILVVFVLVSLSIHLVNSRPVTKRINNRCFQLAYDVVDAKHWILDPRLQWDLLHPLETYLQPHMDKTVTRHWSLWQFDDSKSRRDLLELMGIDYTLFPAMTAQGLLEIPVDLVGRNETPSHYFNIQCLGDPNQCSLLDIGHPSADFPLGLGGALVVDSTPTLLRLQPALDVPVWGLDYNSGLAAPANKLNAVAITREDVRLIYCDASESVREQLWLTPIEQLQIRAYEKRVVGYDSRLNAWCFDSTATEQFNDDDDDVIACSRVCFSPTATTHSIVTTAELVLQRRLLGFQTETFRIGQRYLHLMPPFRVSMSPQTRQVCDTLVIRASTSQQLLKYLTTFRNGTTHVQITGLSKRLEDAQSNGVVFSVQPVIDWVKGTWMLVILAILTRRIVLPRRLMTEAVGVRRQGYGSDYPAIPISHTQLNLDVVLVLVSSATIIWYFVSMTVALPTSPELLSFVVIMVFFFGSMLFTIISTFYLQLIVYAHDLPRCLQQSCIRCFSCILPTRLIVTQEFADRPRAPIWIAMINRHSGNILGFTTLFFAFQWDIYDPYNYSVLVVFGIVVCVYMMEHLAVSASMAVLFRDEFKLALYALVTAALTCLVFITQLYDLWIPYFNTYSSGVYTTMDIELMCYALAIVTLAGLFSIVQVPILRAHRVLRSIALAMGTNANTRAVSSRSIVKLPGSNIKKFM